MSFTIYPAIDLRGGKVVRLKQGDPARLTTYGADPAETARRWLTSGANWLHVVNLDGAFGENDHANRVALQMILNVAQEFNAHIQLGGGIRSRRAIEDAIDLDISRVVLGTIAIEKPEVVANGLARFGAERIVVGIDAREGSVQTRGWKDKSGKNATEVALQMRHLGLQTIIFTDITRDGLGGGLNIASTRELAAGSGLDVIASGGVHTLEDVLAARDAKLAGVVVGRALYEGTINLSEAMNGAGYACQKNHPMP
jgi:phosphoribosylformimino-5-aminoimidazole carboxamide ribotide isomerase